MGPSHPYPLSPWIAGSLERLEKARYLTPGRQHQLTDPIGITANILSAYCFLCNNYNFLSKEDEIILVGYSRGAFTVRCLAAFVSDVGLLRRKYLPFLQIIFNRWLKNDNEREKLRTDIRDFSNGKEYFSQEVVIEVLAEWDTVSAMGSLKYSFIGKSKIVPYAVRNAFFALALDEKRREFEPMLWVNTESNTTTVQQCAFAGCHGDVGGGNPDAGLSTVSFLWMIAQITNVCKARFDNNAMFQFFQVFQYSSLHTDKDITQPRSIGDSIWDKIRKRPEPYVKNLSLSKGSYGCLVPHNLIIG